MLFLLAMFLAPLVAIIPNEAAVPALVLVGFLMMQQVKGIDWDDLEIAIPAFLTIVLMPFTYSITVGIGAGFLAYVLLKVVRGKAGDVHPLMWVVAALFVVYFAIHPIVLGRLTDLAERRPEHDAGRVTRRVHARARRPSPRMAEVGRRGRCRVGEQEVTGRRRAECLAKVMTYANDMPTVQNAAAPTPGWRLSSVSPVMRLRRRLAVSGTPDNELSLGAMAVLGALYRNGDLTVGELAGHERVQPPSMTRTVNCLEEDGYVARRRDETDGRQVVVASPTPAGSGAGRPRPPRRLAGPAAPRPDPEERAVLRRAAPILDRLAQKD